MHASWARCGPSHARSVMNPVPNRRVVAAALVALLLGGCASAPAPAPTAQLEAARQAISDAERAQAGEHAPSELSQARTKLAAANTAVQNQDMDDAARFAEEARVDAMLASARTAAKKAEEANEEIRRGTSALISPIIFLCMPLLVKYLKQWH